MSANELVADATDERDQFVTISVTEYEQLQKSLAEKVETIIKQQTLIATLKESRRRDQLDELTGLYQRRDFKKELSKYLDLLPGNGDEQRRPGLQTLAVVFIDVDDFKNINDTYGHAVGDEVLVKIADTLRTVFSRKLDIVARHSGDEFMVLMPNTGQGDAAVLCQRFCKKVSELKEQLCFAKANRLSVTTSVGLVVVNNRVTTARVSRQNKEETVLCKGEEINVEDFWTKKHVFRADDLIDLSDKTMYVAKKNGRNHTRLSVVSKDGYLIQNKNLHNLNDPGEQSSSPTEQTQQ